MIALCAAFLISISPDKCLSEKWPPVITQYALPILSWGQYYNVHPDLIAAVILSESSGYTNVVHENGIVGLMGVMSSANPDFPNRSSAEALLDPNINIRDGTYILSLLIERYKGDVRLSLAVYNCGEDKVSRNACGSGAGTNYADKIIVKLDKMSLWPLGNKPPLEVYECSRKRFLRSLCY